MIYLLGSGTRKREVNRAAVFPIQTKLKKKKHGFLGQDDIERFAWFTLQPIWTTETAGD